MKIIGDEATRVVAPSPIGRALVPVAPRRSVIPLTEAFDPPSPKPSPLRERVGEADARSISPRRISEISLDLYVNGALAWEEYAMLVFQPELHPDYDRTIGALTGQSAAPDEPRDFVRQWEARLVFERKHNADRPAMVARTQRIVDVLKQLRVAADLTT